MFKLLYKLNDKNMVTSTSNGDVTISSLNENNNTIYKVKANKDITLNKAIINNICKANKKDKLFFNGYQSWTDTKEDSVNSIHKNVNHIFYPIKKMFSMDKYGDSHIYKYSINKLHGLDLFYKKGSNELFVYNLNYKNAYLIIELNKINKSINLISDIDNITLKAGEEIEVFNYKLFNDYKVGLDNFNKDFKCHNNDKIIGYTSWYNYYQNINEDIILKDLDSLDDRFKLFQIDDGYACYCGDWLDIDKNKFPNGLKEVIDKIHLKGLKAGIWLAPFVAESKSKLFNEHKELFKVDEKGNYIKGGCNWSHQYALDLSKKEVWDYISKCLHYFIDLGIDFFKLDFLYASNLGKYDNMSRAQITYDSYKKIKDILKDKIILGCGANTFQSYNLFDYFRVGCDVSLAFDDTWFMRLMHRERVSTKITLQNTIYRNIFDNHLFNNDPDVFILRDNNISLNDKQKESLLIINALFGHLLMTSDNIATYNENKNELLNKALDIYYHATNKSFNKINNRLISISYSLNNNEYKFIYDTKKGEIING